MNNDEFRRMYLGEWPVDPLFEEYLEAWICYHKLVDWDRKIANSYTDGLRRRQDFDKDKWQMAKMDAVRIVEKEEFYALQNKNRRN